MLHPKISALQQIPQYEQRSPEWFAQRKDKLTSSDAAAVTGKNPYCTYDELLLKKCGVEKPFVGNIATLHGQKYEDPAIELYCRVTGRRNYNFGLLNYMDVNGHCEHYNPEHDFLAGSPDGIAVSIDNPESDPVLLEVKCPFRRKIKIGYIPEYYIPQVQLNLYICDLMVADFIEYCPKTGQLNIVRIYRDTMWLNTAFPKLIKFWKDVLYFRDIGINKSEAFLRKCEKDKRSEERKNKKIKIENEKKATVKTKNLSLCETVDKGTTAMDTTTVDTTTVDTKDQQDDLNNCENMDISCSGYLFVDQE